MAWTASLAEWARRFRKNAGYGAETTHGRALTLWMVVGHNGACCPSVTPMWVLSFLCLVATLVANILAFETRAAISHEDTARYGTRAPWFMGIDAAVFACLVVRTVATFAYVAVYGTLSHSELRESNGPPYRPVTLPLKLAWFAYEFAWTASTVLLVLFIVFASTHGHHTLERDRAQFVVNWIACLAITVLTAAHSQFEHIVWILGVGWFFAFVLAPLHYAQADWDDKRPYIYGVADWTHPLQAFASILAVSFLTIAVHAVLCAFSHYKNSRPGFTVYEESPETIEDEVARIVASGIAAAPVVHDRDRDDKFIAGIMGASGSNV